MRVGIVGGALMLEIVSAAAEPAHAAGASSPVRAPATASALPDAPAAPREAPVERASPSFSCDADLSDVERTICASAELATIDREMVAAYSASVSGLAGPRRERAVDVQRRWLALRND